MDTVPWEFVGNEKLCVGNSISWHGGGGSAYRYTVGIRNEFGDVTDRYAVYLWKYPLAGFNQTRPDGFPRRAQGFWAARRPQDEYGGQHEEFKDTVRLSRYGFLKMEDIVSRQIDAGDFSVDVGRLRVNMELLF